MSKMKAGEEVTEIEPDDEGWTLVRTSRGLEGLAPTDYIEWKVIGNCYSVNFYRQTGC